MKCPRHGHVIVRGSQIVLYSDKTRIFQGQSPKPAFPSVCLLAWHIVPLLLFRFGDTYCLRILEKSGPTPGWSIQWLSNRNSRAGYRRCATGRLRAVSIIVSS